MRREIEKRAEGLQKDVVKSYRVIKRHDQDRDNRDDKKSHASLGRHSSRNSDYFLPSADVFCSGGPVTEEVLQYCSVVVVEKNPVWTWGDRGRP